MVIIAWYFFYVGGVMVWCSERRVEGGEMGLLWIDYFGYGIFGR